MRKVPIQIRVDASDLEEWGKRAQKAGENLSEWIRGRCNQNYEDVRGATGVFVAQRGVDVPERRKVRRNRGRVGAIENIVHETHRASGVTDAIDAEIARKSGHPPGCDCAWVCGRMRRMMK